MQGIILSVILFLAVLVHGNVVRKVTYREDTPWNSNEEQLENLPPPQDWFRVSGNHQTQALSQGSTDVVLVGDVPSSEEYIDNEEIKEPTSPQRVGGVANSSRGHIFVKSRGRVGFQIQDSENAERQQEAFTRRRSEDEFEDSSKKPIKPLIPLRNNSRANQRLEHISGRTNGETRQLSLSRQGQNPPIAEVRSSLLHENGRKGLGKPATPSDSEDEDYNYVQSDDLPPPHDQVAKMARYIVQNANWTSLATVSTRSPIKGYPFTNIFSVSDGPTNNSTGVPYMYLTPMEMSVIDLQSDSRASMTMSLAQTDYCRQHEYDPEDPRCAHVILSGHIISVPDNEENFARTALFTRHPEMPQWPRDHGWFFAKMDIENIIVLDYFGGAKTVSPDDYFHY